jgi:hypothetical protein
MKKRFEFQDYRADGPAPLQSVLKILLVPNTLEWS